MFKALNRVVAIAVIFCLVFEQSGFAQVAPQIPIPAYINGYIAPDHFRPVQLRSISFDAARQDFSLYLDRGDDAKAKAPQLYEAGKTLMQYFETGIVLPNSYFWVNLRPDAPDQIIDPHLARTDMGKALLEADLQLKKDMARFTSPNTKEGREYWNKLYAKAQQLYGQSEISIPTVTRPWIVPGEILVRQSESSAYILKATLKVMLEQDYLADAKYTFDDARVRELNQYSSDIIRTEILPKLTREVNTSKKYAGMRQAYYSLVLAQWFKAHYRGKDGAYASRIDTKVLDGLTSSKAWSKDTYFNAYKKSFEKGEYNISETVPSANGLTVRQYFSGGADFSRLAIHPMSEGAAVGTAAGPVSDQAVRALQSGLIERTPDGTIRDGGTDVTQGVDWKESLFDTIYRKFEYSMPSTPDPHPYDESGIESMPAIITMQEYLGFLSNEFAGQPEKYREFKEYVSERAATYKPSFMESLDDPFLAGLLLMGSITFTGMGIGLLLFGFAGFIVGAASLGASLPISIWLERPRGDKAAYLLKNNLIKWEHTWLSEADSKDGGEEQSDSEKSAQGGSRLLLASGIMMAFAGTVWILMIPFHPMAPFIAIMHWVSASFMFVSYGFQAQQSSPANPDEQKKDGGTRRGPRINYKILNLLGVLDMADALGLLTHRKLLMRYMERKAGESMYADFGLQAEIKSRDGGSNTLTVRQLLRIWWAAEKILLGASVEGTVDSSWNAAERAQLMHILKQYPAESVVDRVITSITGIDRGLNAVRALDMLKAVPNDGQKKDGGTELTMNQKVFLEELEDNVKAGKDVSVRDLMLAADIDASELDAIGVEIERRMAGMGSRGAWIGTGAYTAVFTFFMVSYLYTSGLILLPVGLLAGILGGISGDLIYKVTGGYGNLKKMHSMIISEIDQQDREPIKVRFAEFVAQHQARIAAQTGKEPSQVDYEIARKLATRQLEQEVSENSMRKDGGSPESKIIDQARQFYRRFFGIVLDEDITLPAVLDMINRSRENIEYLMADAHDAQTRTGQAPDPLRQRISRAGMAGLMIVSATGGMMLTNKLFGEDSHVSLQESYNALLQMGGDYFSIMQSYSPFAASAATVEVAQEPVEQTVGDASHNDNGAYVYLSGVLLKDGKIEEKRTAVLALVACEDKDRVRDILNQYNQAVTYDGPHWTREPSLGAIERDAYLSKRANENVPLSIMGLAMAGDESRFAEAIQLIQRKDTDWMFRTGVLDAVARTESGRDMIKVMLDSESVPEEMKVDIVYAIYKNSADVSDHSSVEYQITDTLDRAGYVIARVDDERAYGYIRGILQKKSSAYGPDLLPMKIRAVDYLVKSINKEKARSIIDASYQEIVNYKTPWEAAGMTPDEYWGPGESSPNGKYAFVRDTGIRDALRPVTIMALVQLGDTAKESLALDLVKTEGVDLALRARAINALVNTDTGKSELVNMLATGTLSDSYRLEVARQLVATGECREAESYIENMFLDPTKTDDARLAALKAYAAAKHKRYETLLEVIKGAKTNDVSLRKYAASIIVADEDATMISLLEKSGLAQELGLDLAKKDKAAKDGGLETEQAPPAKTGGIDFRALPVESQPAMTPAAISQVIAEAPVLSAQEMDETWASIQKSMAGGSMPYAELKKFVSCCYAQNDSTHKKAATECVLNLLKLEEERAISTPDELKGIIVLL